MALTTVPSSMIQQMSAANMPNGSVIQTVNASFASQTGTSSGSFVDTGLTATITPQFSTSKILIFASQTGLQKPATDIRVQLQLVRNGSNIIYFESEALYNGGSTGLDSATSVTYLDSPATTSAIVYKTQIRIGSGSGTVYWNTVGGSSVTGASTITLLEIKQ